MKIEPFYVPIANLSPYVHKPYLWFEFLSTSIKLTNVERFLRSNKYVKLSFLADDKNKFSSLVNDFT